MAELERINPDWKGEPCIVAAPGPSLTEEVAQKCRMKRWLEGWRIVVVQDAYRLMPFADAMYGCDDRWWNLHGDCAGFQGEKWSTHEMDGNDKLGIADKYGVRLVAGDHGDDFSTDPTRINYGWNSGFQGLNLALLKGCTRIVLVGFDMRSVGGKSHFFGDHPPKLRAGRQDNDYERFAPRFAFAAKSLKKDIRIVNATPGSALTCFKMMSLDDALKNDSLHRDRPEPDPSASSVCA